MLFLKSSERTSGSDNDLIEKYRNSREVSYIGELFQRYTHLVFGVCMKYLKNQEDSKDAVMEIFEKMLVDLRKHEIENFKPWLYFVAKNHCLMKIRKEKSLLPHNENLRIFMKEVVEFPDGLHLNSESLDGQMELHLQNGIETLNEEQKACIRLFYFESRSYQDITDSTGYSMKQVKSFLQNGKRNLKLYLKAKA